MLELINNLKFAWIYAKDQKKRIIAIIVVNIVGIILCVIAPILSARMIISLTSNDYLQIVLIALVILIIEVFNNIFTYIGKIITIKIDRETLSKLETDLGKNILKLDNKCLDREGSGVFIQRLTNDTSKMSEVFSSILNMSSQIIEYIGILIAILIVNKIVFCYILVVLIILYIIDKKRTTKRNALDKICRKSQEKVTGFIGELVRGVRDIKMLSSEKDFIDELAVRIDDANYKNMQMNKINWSYRLMNWELTSIFSFIHIILLVLLMNEGILATSIALVLYNYTERVYYSVYLIGDLLEYIKDFNLSSERIFAIINNPEFSKEKFGTKHLNNIEGNFEFKNVSFGYNDKQVLNNISFKINANETVAFVGKSGAGKTTIFNLLCKMYDIKEGTITIDGIDIKKLDKDSIRNNITIISQNPYIFNMSIKDNLKLVKSNLRDEDMYEACSIACLDDFINKLPNKYDTIIGEGGVNLSGGQKQRLAIARALVQKTEIILFDEATSALDNETQTKIQEAISNMKNEYTILIIAHRLSTIVNADKILFLDDGRIKAEGTHLELLKKSKEYKKLYESEIRKDE